MKLFYSIIYLFINLLILVCTCQKIKLKKKAEQTDMKLFALSIKE